MITSSPMLNSAGFVSMIKILLLQNTTLVYYTIQRLTSQGYNDIIAKQEQPRRAGFARPEGCLTNAKTRALKEWIVVHTVFITDTRKEL
jgi:hypothetical protein